MRVTPLALVLLAACATSRPPEMISAPTAEGRLVSVDSLTTDYTVGGVHIVQRPSYANDVVAVDLYLLGGTQQLSPATAGIEALALRAAEYGTTRYRGRESQRALMRTGGQFVIDPTSDWTLVGFRGVAEQFDSTWAVFADRICQPTLDSSSVAVARHRMILTARARDISPDGALAMLADSVAFGGHPYGLEVEGTEASLNALSPEDLRRYVHDQFVTSRMLLVIVGNVPRASVEAVVTRTLGTLPSGSYAWRAPPPVTPRTTPSLTVVQRPMQTNYILGYFQGPPITSPDYPAFELATEMLGGRLSNAIRQERSLSYAAQAAFFGRALATGGVYVSTPLPNEVMPVIRAMIDSMHTTEVTWPGLDYFVRQFVTSYLARNGSNAAQAASLAEAQIYLGDYRKASAAMTTLRGVSPYALQLAARRYMRNTQFVYLGDTTRMRGVRVTGM